MPRGTAFFHTTGEKSGLGARLSYSAEESAPNKVLNSDAPKRGAPVSADVRRRLRRPPTIITTLRRPTRTRLNADTIYQNPAGLLPIMIILLSLASARAQAPSDSLARAYTQACYTGVVQAQRVLPDVPQKDKLLARGYLSCDGSLLRMTNTGQLHREPSISELGCGYAVGAMFAKYGFTHEADPPSSRVLQAAKACQEIVARQGIK